MTTSARSAVPGSARSAGRHRAGRAGPANPAAGDTSPVSDADLLAAVRAGATSAYGDLYGRHQEAARRLARALVRDPSDAEDLVAEAFTRVLAMLRTGHGPQQALRPYLLTVVRNACYDRARRDRRLELTEDMSQFQAPATGATGDPAVARLERSYAARAFARLPERWQLVLWHTEVEGEKPARIAPLLGLTPAAVASLAYRARERLRQMYLQEHLRGTSDPSCRWTADRLGAYVRRGLARRERTRVDAHLADCPDCRTLWIELGEVNAGLRGVLAPVALGAAAGPYLAATTGGTAGLAGWLAAGWSGLVQQLQAGWDWLAGQGRRLVQRYGPGNVAAGAGVAAATLVGVALFALAVVVDPTSTPPGGADQRPPPPQAVQPGLPVPTPAPVPLSPTPGPSADPQQPDAGPADRPATGPGAVPQQPAPAAEPVLVAPDLSGTHLAAGGPGELALQVHLPAQPAAGELEAAGPEPEAARPQVGRPVAAATGEVALAIRWPAGITLTDPDAGDSWRCTAGEAGAACRRPAWAAGQTRTARLPVAVAPDLGGLITLAVAVTAGNQRGQQQLRVPVAPVGMQLGYAATGPYRLAAAGNTWLSCPDRPACWQPDRLDNDLVDLVPYRPGPGEPGLPRTPLPGVAEELAASGAELAVPGRAKVAWAGLWWATTAGTGPGEVALHGPDGGWHRVAPDAVRTGADRPLWQAYAEVTGLVAAAPAGSWWLAADAGTLPTGPAVAAGWSLTVVYEQPAAPVRDVAVLAGPVSLSPARSLSAATDTDGAVEVGLVAWEGDRRHPGAQLRLGGTPLGDPENVTASRAAGALECAGEPAATCRWHTFGVDVAVYAGTGGPVALTTPADLVEVGVLALAVDAPR